MDENSIVESLKESGNKFIAAAKKHPKIAAAVAVVIVGVMVWAYLKAKNAAAPADPQAQAGATTAGTAADSGLSGGSSTFTLPTSTGGSTTPAVSYTTPSIPLTGLGDLSGYNTSSPVANFNSPVGAASLQAALNAMAGYNQPIAATGGLSVGAGIPATDAPAKIAYSGYSVGAGIPATDAPAKIAATGGLSIGNSTYEFPDATATASYGVSILNSFSGASSGVTGSMLAGL